MTDFVPDLLDVVVRFHDIERIGELDRCIFSLVCQSYRPLRINVMTQRFSPEAIARLEDALQPLLEIGAPLDFRVLNYSEPEPLDARSALINAAITLTDGQYLAFLDYDDVIYAEGYEALVTQLRESGDAIAFACVASKFVSVDPYVSITLEKKLHYRGNGAIDLFFDNFCPLHSYMLDRSKVDSADIYFDESLSVLEDYDFLLRICSRYRSNFVLKDFVIGDYYFKDDGSNTTLLASTATDERKASWEASRRIIADRKTKTRVALSVQRALGISPVDVTLTLNRAVELHRKSG